MARRVVKIGGSVLVSARDVIRLRAIAGRYDRPVLVVSAFAGVTDMLASLASGEEERTAWQPAVDGIRARHEGILRAVTEPGACRERTLLALDRLVLELGELVDGVAKLGEASPSVTARLLSYGERLAVLVVCAGLQEAGLPAEVVWPEAMGLRTSGDFLEASVDLAASAEPVARALSAVKLPVVPGFYGTGPDGRLTLLGRGGSDYAAAGIAACIGAASLDVWKDVKGFMSADPKVVREARPVPRLSYREAAELSYFGARILHPRTVEPLQEREIPVRVFNYRDRVSGPPVTRIGCPVPVGGDVVKGVSFRDDVGVLTVRGAGVGMCPGVLAAIAGVLATGGINILSVMTAQTAINLLLDRSDVDPALNRIRRESPAAVTGTEPMADAGVVAVVGEGILDRPGVVSRMLTALAEEDINVRMIALGASPVAAYVVVREIERPRAVAAVHRAFFPVGVGR